MKNCKYHLTNFFSFFLPSDNKSWKKMCNGKSWIESLRYKGRNYSGVLQPWSHWKKSRSCFDKIVFQEYPKIRLLWPMWKASNKSKNHELSQNSLFSIDQFNFEKSRDFSLDFTHFRHFSDWFTKTKQISFSAGQPASSFRLWSTDKVVKIRYV